MDASTIAHNPISNKIYAASSMGSDVFIIDGASNSIIRQVEATRAPVSFCVNTTNNRVFMGSIYNDTVAVIDGVGDTLITRIAVGKRAAKLTCSPASNRVYVSGREDTSVIVIDAVQNIVVDSIKCGNMPYNGRFVPSSNRIYMQDFSGQMHVIDCEGDSVVKRISGVGAGWGDSTPVYDSIAHKVYSTEYGPKIVHVIDCRTDTVVTSIGAGGDPTCIIWNPTSRRVYVGRYSGGLAVIRDSAVVACEDRTGGRAARGAPATIISNGVVRLGQAERAVLCDAAGRQLARLQPGRNYVGRFAAGVYFLRPESPGLGQPRKVLLAR
jgi:YVTN family beta-propeller protein